jgi:phage protein D
VIRRDAPQFYVQVVLPGAGDATRTDAQQKITNVEFEDDEKKSDKLTFTVDNFDLKAFEEKTWRKGNVLRFSWGYPGAMSPERECVITKVTGGTELKIEAAGKEAVLNRKRKVRVFENMTRSQVVAQVLAEYGLVIAEIEDSQVVYPQITQASTTDYQFIRDLARRERFEFFLDFDGAHFHRRKLGQKPLREFWYYNDPGQGDILPGWTIDNDISASKPGAVQAQGRNPDTKEDIDVTANNDNTPRDGTAAVLEVVSEIDGTAHDVENNATKAVVATTEVTEAAALRQAQGLYTAAQVNAVKLTLPCIGDPNLVAKSVIRVQGLGPVLSGNYYVSKVKHSLKSGYSMTISVQRDGHGQGGGAAQTAASKATQNDKDVPANQDGLDPQDDVNQVDGTTQTTYHDRRGRNDDGGGA